MAFTNMRPTPVSTKELPVIIGLTGGIASGKSTVSNFFREQGVTVLDADQLAREVVAPGRPALEEIAEAFGTGVIAPDGSLDRPGLAQIIFSDPEARNKLESITHPRIAEAMIEGARDAAHRGEAWVIYDAALIVEKGHHHWLDSLIVVAVLRATQMKRLIARDGLNEEEALSRLEAQMPLDEKVAVATFVIDNAGSLEDTRRQVEALHQLIDRRVQSYGSAKSAPEQPTDHEE